MIGRDSICIFQPIMDSDSGKLYAAESLLRFKDSTGEMISPVEFIPILKRVV